MTINFDEVSHAVIVRVGCYEQNKAVTELWRDTFSGEDGSHVRPMNFKRCVDGDLIVFIAHLVFWEERAEFSPRGCEVSEEGIKLNDEKPYF